MSIFSIVNVVIKLTLGFQNNQSNGQLFPIYEVGVKKFVARHQGHPGDDLGVEGEVKFLQLIFK